MARPRTTAALILGLAWAAQAHASEGGGGQELIQPQLGTVFWTLLTFAIMVALLGRYAWKPLLGALEAREGSIRDSLDHARREREEAAGLLEQQRSLLTEARRERAEALAQGRRDAEKLKAEIIDEAQRQREQLLRQADAQLATSVRRARAELRAFTSDLAIQAAGKLLSKNLDEPTQRRLVEEYLDDLERSAPPSGSLPS
jgi:F-type H+-transporting ATPase subunit b